jgi:hypothetical protein
MLTSRTSGIPATIVVVCCCVVPLNCSCPAVTTPLKFHILHLLIVAQIGSDCANGTKVAVSAVTFDFDEINKAIRDL